MLKNVCVLCKGARRRVFPLTELPFVSDDFFTFGTFVYSHLYSCCKEKYQNCSVCLNGLTAAFISAELSLQCSVVKISKSVVVLPNYTNRDFLTLNMWEMWIVLVCDEFFTYSALRTLILLQLNRGE